MTSYEKDFYKWTNEQVMHLKNREFNELDTRNLIDEIISLGEAKNELLEAI